MGISNSKGVPRSVAWTLKPSFAFFSDIQSSTPPLFRPIHSPGGDGEWRTRPPLRPTVMPSPRRRGAYQRKKCGWHLSFCAGLTRSAPLGSHFGTSLLRRSLASPYSILYRTLYSINIRRNYRSEVSSEIREKFLPCYTEIMVSVIEKNIKNK